MCDAGNQQHSASDRPCDLILHLRDIYTVHGTNTSHHQCEDRKHEHCSRTGRRMTVTSTQKLSSNFMPSHDPHLKSYNSLSEDRGTAYTVVISTSLNNIPPLYYTISYTSLNYFPPIYIQKSLSKWGTTDKTGKKKLTNGIVRYEPPPCYSPAILPLFPRYSPAIHRYSLAIPRYSLAIPFLFLCYSLLFTAILRYPPLFPCYSPAPICWTCT